MAFPSSPNRIIQALEALSVESDDNLRKLLLRSSLKEMIKWFTLAARKLIQGQITVPKQTQTYINKHKNEISQLADAGVDLDTKKQIILKPGGGGFLGGVLIRSLLKWNNKGKKTARTRTKKTTTTRKTRKTKKKSDRFVTVRRKRKSPPISPILSSPSITPQHSLTQSPNINPSVITSPVSTHTSTPKSGQYINVPGFQTPRSHLTTPSYQSSSLSRNSSFGNKSTNSSRRSNRSKRSSSGHWSSSTISSDSTPPLMRFSPLRGGLSRPASIAFEALPPNLRPRHLFPTSQQHSSWLGVSSVVP